MKKTTDSKGGFKCSMRSINQLAEPLCQKSALKTTIRFAYEQTEQSIFVYSLLILSNIHRCRTIAKNHNSSILIPTVADFMRNSSSKPSDPHSLLLNFFCEAI